MSCSRTRSYVLGSLVALSLGGTALARPVTNNPVPVLYPIAPAATSPGGQAYTLAVKGFGFVPGATVKWNGSALVTTFVDSSSLTPTVPAPSLGTPRTATITVANPPPGGGTSNVQYFDVENSISQNYFSSRSITGNVNLTSPIVGGDFDNDGKLDILVASGP